MEVLHHLADAIAALKKAYEVKSDETVLVHIKAAEASAFRAVRAVADGQVDDCASETDETVLPENLSETDEPFRSD
jgi:hypothetical protein